jgi:hypothetical protein
MNRSVKVTPKRSPFLTLKKSIDQEYIFVILCAKAAPTPAFPKVSDKDPFNTVAIVLRLMVIGLVFL